MSLRILDRYLLKNFFRLFTIFMLGAPLLFILGDATENLDRYLDRGITFPQVAVSYLYQFPHFMAWSFPVAALLATVFTIHPMTNHREVMAAKAGGVSFHRLVAPLFVAGFLLTLAGLALTELAPRANQMAAELRGERERRVGWRSNFVYLTDGGEALSARRLTLEDGRMVGVLLESFSRNGTDPVHHTVAEEAHWEAGTGWVLREGYTRQIFPDGREVSFRFSRYARPDITEGPADLVEGRAIDPDEMTYAELGRFGERLERSGASVGRTLTKREQRLAIPVATLVIILFGAPLATSSRRGGTAFGVGLSLLTTILYLVMLRVTGSLGYAEILDPRMAAWIPNMVFAVAGGFFLVRVRT